MVPKKFDAQLVRTKIGLVAALKTAMGIKGLPRTRSGKILRGTMQNIAYREGWKIPATINDPILPDEIKVALINKCILKKVASWLNA